MYYDLSQRDTKLGWTRTPPAFELNIYRNYPDSHTTGLWAKHILKLSGLAHHQTLRQTHTTKSCHLAISYKLKPDCFLPVCVPPGLLLSLSTRTQNCRPLLTVLSSLNTTIVIDPVALFIKRFRLGIHKDTWIVVLLVVFINQAKKLSIY